MAKAVAAKAKQQFTEVAPNAAKTLSALREMGYDSFSSVLDLIDNSIDAGATKIAVTIREAGNDIAIDIRDNGSGMDEKVLTEALRLGSDVEHDVNEDLGKFGMGLVTASISMARNVYVITRKKGATAYEATFDLDTINRENRFVITLHPATRSDKVLDLVGNEGTLVRLSRIDRINDSNVARFAQKLRDRIGQVYRHFLEKGITIAVNNRHVLRLDPLMLDHELTQVVFDEDVTIEKGKVFHLKVVNLPELGQGGDAEANITPHNSGFYVVRNDREIMDAQTFGFYQRHHSYSHFRAELSFTGDLDAEFHVDIKKATIHPGDRLLTKLQEKTRKLIADAGKRDRVDAPPVKLHHGAADVINTALPALLGVKVPTPKKTEGPKLAQGAVAEAEAKKKQARKLDIVEEDKKAQATQPEPATPHVQFLESDLGDTGRFFASEVKKTGEVVITYNTRHPFIRLLGDVRSKQAHSLVDFMAFALAKAEVDVEGGHKVVNKACDYLKALATTPAAAAAEG
jgi:hypothetical protein